MLLSHTGESRNFRTGVGGGVVNLEYVTKQSWEGQIKLTPEMIGEKIVTRQETLIKTSSESVLLS